MNCAMMHGSTNIKYHRGVIEDFGLLGCNACQVTQHYVSLHQNPLIFSLALFQFQYFYVRIWKKMKNENKTKKVNWIGHVLSEKFLLKHGTEGKIKREKNHERKRKKT